MLYRNGRKVDSGDESMDEEDDSGGSLIPKSILPEGAKVGDTIKFKISHLFEDEAEIQYSHSKSDKDKSDSDTDKSDDEQPPQEKEAFEEISADA